MSTSTNHVVSFNGSSLTFDFINLDINSVLKIYDHNINRLNTILEMLDIDIGTSIQENPYFQQYFDAEQFSDFDAIAILPVPKDKFDSLFKINIKYEDLEDSSLNSFKYAVNPIGWFGGLDEDVSFSEAIVTDETAIDPYAKDEYQQIKRDFIRHVLKSITNSVRLNALFANKTNLVHEASLLDALFNAQIRDILLRIGGKMHDPLDNSVTTSNPVRTLLNNILSTTNTTNEERKILFLDYLETKTNQIYEDSKTNDYYVLGTTTQGYGLYYPLRIETLHPSFQVQYQEIHFSDVFTNQTFYMPISGQAAVDPGTNPDLSGLVDYNSVDQTFIDIPFQYNDNLAIKLTYHPKSTTYLNRTLTPRSYKILLNMSMEMTTGISYDDTFLINSIGIDYSNTTVDVSDLYVRKGTLTYDNDLSKNVFHSSTYNNHLMWIFWNDTGTLDGETTGISPYNYYPRLKDISNIEFSTNQGTDANETRNWALEIYTRKMNIDEELNYSNKYTTLTQQMNHNVSQNVSTGGEDYVITEKTPAEYGWSGWHDIEPNDSGNYMLYSWGEMIWNDSPQKSRTHYMESFTDLGTDLSGYLYLGTYTENYTHNGTVIPLQGWYYRSTASLSWENAKVAAETAGPYTHLIVERSETQRDAVNAMGGWLGGGVWSGLFQDTTDPSYSEPGGAWKWVSYTIPNITENTTENTTENISGLWYHHNISNLMWNDTFDNSGNFETIKTNITPPYENDINENQQILGIALTLSDDDSYYGFLAKLNDVNVIFHDKRQLFTTF